MTLRYGMGVGVAATAVEGTKATARTLAPENPETQKLSVRSDSSLKINSSAVS